MSKKVDSQKNQRIQVFARCRPLNAREKGQGSPSIVEVVQEKKEIAIKDRNTRREFFFDKVFSPETKQIAIYKAVVEPLIQEVLMGFNCTVFAYGQTGTGKTYTMEGERSDSQCSWENDPGAGIIPRSLHQLFEELNKEENVEFDVRVSFLELYNEELFDLLGATDFSKLRLYEDPIKKGSVIIQGLEDVPVNNKDEVYAILEKGTARRQTAATMLNATSSRSHTVFSVTVRIKENTIDGEELLKIGKLNLVDLAGSENVGRSGAVDKRAREAGNINQSLLTLGRVITALIEKQPHVPYRESKLTRILQDSLGGHTKTSIIATISPAHLNLDETVSTLDYATKAKSITIRPEANQKMTKRAVLREYTEQIEKLKKDLFAAQSQTGYYVDAENYKKMENDLEEKGENLKKLQEIIDDLNEKKLMIEQLFLQTKEKLQKKDEECDVLSSKFKQKSIELKQNQKALSETALQRDETAHLLKAHCSTEKKLQQQTETCLKVIGQVENDVKQLHAKIDRKNKVEHTNEKHIENFNIMRQKQQECLFNIANEISFQKFNDIADSLTRVSSDMNVHKRKTSIALHEIVSKLEDYFSKIRLDLEKDMNDQNQWGNTTLESLEIRKQEISADHNEFSTEKFSQLVKNLQIIFSENSNFVISSHNAIIQKVQEIESSMKTECKNVLNSINTLCESFDLYHETNEALIKELNDKSKRLSLLEEKHDQYFEGCLGDLNLVIKSMENKWKEFKHEKEEINLPAVYESLNKECVKPKQINELIKEEVKNVEELSANIMKNICDVPSEFKMDQFVSNQELQNTSLKSMSTEVNKFLQNNQKNTESFFQKIKSSISSVISTVQANFMAKDLKLKEVSDDLSENVKAEDSTQENRSNDLINKISSVKTNVEVQTEQLNTTVEKLRREILQRDQEIEHFISKDLQKDIPTGTTPLRKNYEYPKEIPVTSPDDRILNRLRLNLKKNTDIAVNLPLDSSFEESDEFKSPLSQENTEPADGNVFSTDEEDYSTGCESNASSMSDLTLNSLRNKENWKNISNKSHLPKAKFKKPKSIAKLESAKSTPNTRKPLYSKNP